MLKIPSLVEYALRQTLVADALSLQFKLPPAGVPWPGAHANPDVAFGAPLVHTLVVTSVWVIQVLRCLCQVRTHTVVSIVIAAMHCLGVHQFGNLGCYTTTLWLSPQSETCMQFMQVQLCLYGPAQPGCWRVTQFQGAFLATIHCLYGHANMTAAYCASPMHDSLPLCSGPCLVIWCLLLWLVMLSCHQGTALLHCSSNALLSIQA